MTSSRPRRDVWLLLAFLLVALVLAGVASHYASSAPDGLNKVAADERFNQAEQRHDLEDSPLAGYSTRGVDNERLSGGVAGVIGVGVTLVVAGGGALLLRRRSSRRVEDAPSGPGA